MSRQITIQLLAFAEVGEFEWRWPSKTVEHFHRSWTGELAINGVRWTFRHGLGRRQVYGRERVHSVTWAAGAPMVEGVEADDYERSRSLISVLRRPDKKHVGTEDEIPPGYDGFIIVTQRSEIKAPYSPSGLAVKIVEDNVTAWATHATIRAVSLEPTRARSSNKGAKTCRAGLLASRGGGRPPMVPPISSQLPPTNPAKVVQALLEFARTKSQRQQRAKRRFEPTPDAEANDFVTEDPFAFLVAVIADQGISAERAWRAPLELRRRLGHFDPARIADEQRSVQAAVEGTPKLHRFPVNFARWVTSAAHRVMTLYQGKADQIWIGKPTARDLQNRLEKFDGVGQKKAAMSVEILERNLGVPVGNLEGSDVAYDVHIRRVFLRTDLAQRDDLDHIVAAARKYYPRRPGALDGPA